MTPGALAQYLHKLFRQKENFNKLLYISWQKGDHYYIQTRHNDLFSHYNLFLRKLKEKWP